MADPQRDIVFEADGSIATKDANGSVATKNANGSIATKTSDGDLGVYTNQEPDLAFWRDAQSRPIRDASGNSIRVRIA